MMVAQRPTWYSVVNRAMLSRAMRNPLLLLLPLLFQLNGNPPLHAATYRIPWGNGPLEEVDAKLKPGDTIDFIEPDGTVGISWRARERFIEANRTQQDTIAALRKSFGDPDSTQIRNPIPPRKGR